MKSTRAQVSALLVTILAMMVAVSGISPTVKGEGTRGSPLILTVGQLSEMMTRNVFTYLANDIWTRDVLDRIYDTVGKIHPDTEEIMPYIVKGIDADDDGVFETDEYGVFAKTEGKDALNITAYYDFNGVYFHDGIQATSGDLLFTYHVAALNSQMSDPLRVLMDKAGRTGSNFTTTRWLFVAPAVKVWENEPVAGNSDLRFAVRFRLQEPFVLFYRHTLAGQRLFPRHVWEQTGWRVDLGTGNTVSPLHADFGFAVYPESDARFGLGVSTTETTYTPFVYANFSSPAEDSAEEWQLSDQDVIGTGPFTLEKYDEVLRTALVFKNALYFAGTDEKTGILLDASVAAYIHQPYLDGILFQTYGQIDLCLRAFMEWSLDFCHLSFPPEYVLDLLNGWGRRLFSRPDPGFAYLGYNMRRPAFGTWHYGQADQFDVGLHFRRAVAHLIDKQTIVKDFLQGYGDPGVVPISPDNTMFYNATLTGYDFNRTQAEVEMDLAHSDAVWLSNNGGPPEAVTWYTKDPGTNLYIMPGIGTSQFNLWCPNADYDPVRANSCTMIAYEMNKIGINVKAKPAAFSVISQLVGVRDFDMYILDWRIGWDDPDYFYGLLHSSNAASGQNYGGFNDATLDWILEESRKESDKGRRVQLFRWAQGILAEKLPYDVLYFRMNIEATKQDKFVGWEPQYGTIWNYWSLLNIHPPAGTRYHVTIETRSAILAGQSVTLTVKVHDQDGEPVDGAEVQLTASPEQGGSFSYGGGPPRNNLTAIAGLGKLQVTYIAPDVDIIRNVTITATAHHPDLPFVPEASTSYLISVYPVGKRFLAVAMDILDSDVVETSGTIRLGITVSDPNGMPANDAWVSAKTQPALDSRYGLNRTEGSAAEMRELKFRAPPSVIVQSNETPFMVIVNATAPLSYNGSSFATLIVVRLMKSCPHGYDVPTDQECGPEVPRDSHVLLAIVVVASVILAVIVSVAVERQERQKGPGSRED